MRVVSINGPDNSGKTTHIMLLPQHWSIQLGGSLHDHSEEISTMLKDGTFKTWWWKSTDECFVSVVFKALATRAHKARGTGCITVMDRGTAMFEAVSIAVIAIKNKHYDLARAETSLKSIRTRLGLRVPEESVAILLKQHQDVARATRIGLEREKTTPGGRYRMYQTLLHQAIRQQELKGVYQHVIVESGPESHRRVQDEIRAAISDYEAPHLFLPVMVHVKRIYAIGGLSECGKSTIASRLVQHIGHTAHRLKIAYLLDQASCRAGKNIYDESEKDQAIALMNELESYSRAHYWLEVLTLESVHRYTSTKWLKTWLESKLSIIFIDTDTRIRKVRNCGSEKDFERKDATKVARGADTVKRIADIVLDNNGPIDSTMTTLLNGIEMIRGAEHK